MCIRDRSKASYVGLTREEHEYVIDHPIIHVGYLKNSYPLQYTDDEGRFGGISRRFFDYFSEKIFSVTKLKHTNVLKAEWYYFLAVCIYSLNLSLTNK